MMKVELTAENRPACSTHSDSAESTGDVNKTTDEDEGRVQVLVVLFRVIAIKLSRFSTVYSKEVGSGILGPQRFDKLFEGGVEAGSACQRMVWVSR